MKYLKSFEKSNKYEYDIFFKVQDLSFETKKDVLKWAYDHSYKFNVDVLRGLKPRQKTDMDFEEGMLYFTDDSHFVIIYRRGYENSNTPDGWDKWHLEIAFRTMKATDYFMFIYCDEELVDECVKKFNLTTL